MTRRLQQACELLGIEFVDHIVVAGEKFVSINELNFT